MRTLAVAHCDGRDARTGVACVSDAFIPMTEPTSPPTTADFRARNSGRWRAAARTVAGKLLRWGLLGLGFLLMLGALFAGLVLALLLVLWSLLRGRRPSARVFRSAFERGRQRAHVSPGQVIDVELREVPEPLLPRRDS